MAETETGNEKIVGAPVFANTDAAARPRSTYGVPELLGNNRCTNGKHGGATPFAAAFSLVSPETFKIQCGLWDIRHAGGGGRRSGARKQRSAVQARSPSVLVVDDDQDVRSTLAAILLESGYRVDLASNGREALAAARAGDFDIILIDIVMPVGEGIETIVALKKDGCASRLIAMSGGGQFNTPYYLKAAKDLGADAVLPKPFTQAELRRAFEGGRTRDRGDGGRARR